MRPIYNGSRQRRNQRRKLVRYLALLGFVKEVEKRHGTKGRNVPLERGQAGDSFKIRARLLFGGGGGGIERRARREHGRVEYISGDE